MALSSSIVWEVQTGGNAANGGGFKSGATGTDRSQQAAPHVTIDGATITAVVHTTTTQLTLTGHTVAAADVGNVVNINGGTATAGRYEITAVDTVNNRWTLDRSAGTAAQTATGRMGGAVASLATVAAYAVSQNKCYIKAGTYVESSLIDTGGNWSNYWIEGYTTTRGDGTEGAATIQAGAAVVLLRARHNGHSRVQYLCFDGNNVGGAGIDYYPHAGGSNETIIFRCEIKRFTGGGMYTSAGYGSVTLLKCRLHSNQNGIVGGSGSGLTAYGCRFYSNSQSGCRSIGNWNMVNCEFSGNTEDGFSCVGTGSGVFSGCVFANNGQCGFDYDDFSAHPSHFRNCVFYGNTSFAARNNDRFYLDHCAYPSGSMSSLTATLTLDGNQTLTADPFTNGAGFNFAPNSVAGGGLALRALGFPGTMPGGATVGYADIGIQSQGSGGGGLRRGDWSGGFNG